MRTASTRLRRTGQGNVALRSLSLDPRAPFEHPLGLLRVMPATASSCGLQPLSRHKKALTRPPTSWPSSSWLCQAPARPASGCMPVRAGIQLQTADERVGHCRNDDSDEICQGVSSFYCPFEAQLPRKLCGACIWRRHAYRSNWTVIEGQSAARLPTGLFRTFSHQLGRRSPAQARNSSGPQGYPGTMPSSSCLKRHAQKKRYRPSHRQQPPVVQRQSTASS